MIGDVVEEASRKQIERETYDRKRNLERPSFGSFWDPELWQAMHASRFDKDVFEMAKAHLAGRRTLILGAGPHEVEVVSKHTDNFVANNISEKALADLKERFGPIETMLADAEQLSTEETFDVVYCKSVLHHLHPIEDVVRNIARLLNPGGVLLVGMEPGLYNPFAALARTITPSQSHTPGERPFVFSRFNRVLQDAGFEELETHYYFLASMLLPFAARKVPALRPLCAKLLEPCLSVEDALQRIPGSTDLYWVVSGAYRLA